MTDGSEKGRLKLFHLTLAGNVAQKQTLPYQFPGFILHIKEAETDSFARTSLLNKLNLPGS